jgi:hypothetical protein
MVGIRKIFVLVTANVTRSRPLSRIPTIALGTLILRRITLSCKHSPFLMEKLFEEP